MERGIGTEDVECSQRGDTMAYYGMPKMLHYSKFSYLFIRSSSLLLFIFIFVFNLCSFLLYLFCFYSIFDHLYSIYFHFYCLCTVSILYSIILYVIINDLYAIVFHYYSIYIPKFSIVFNITIFVL